MRQFAEFFWFLALLLPLFFVQRKLHFETQATLLLLTRRSDVSILFFSILFFPGVLLHETSHYLMAKLLGVKTVRFSLIPQTSTDGRIQLGYVETNRTDLIRDALIGAAPFIAGCFFVAFAGVSMLGLDSIWQAIFPIDFELLTERVLALSNQPDFWIWLYLTVAVSSTMLPSESDRRAWFPIAFGVTIFILLLYFLGMGDWLFVKMSPYVSWIFQSLVLVISISLLIQLLVLVPMWGLRLLIGRVTNTRIE
jgi:hypothetical protein